MRLRSIPEAAQLLGIDAQRLRRGIQSGRYAHYEIEGRILVDVDALGEIIEAERRTISIEEAAQLTGLTKTMIRRGAKGGWLPCERIGKAYRFTPARLLEALEGRKKD